MGLINDRFTGVYASINAEGAIRVKVEEGTPGSKFVEYELKDGTKGSKWVLEYNKLSGYITDIRFLDGNFGEQLNVVMRDKDGEVILTLPIKSNYSMDLMKKLPNIDFTKEVVIAPYSFEDDKKKTKKGITLMQGENKIKSFFSDEKGLAINDFPIVQKEMAEMKKDDWTIYFINVTNFLKEYTQNNICQKIEVANQSNIYAFDEEKVDEVSIDDIPFTTPGEVFEDPKKEEEKK